MLQICVSPVIALMRHVPSAPPPIWYGAASRATTMQMPISAAPTTIASGTERVGSLIAGRPGIMPPFRLAIHAKVNTRAGERHAEFRSRGILNAQSPLLAGDPARPSDPGRGLRGLLDQRDLWCLYGSAILD